MFELSLIKKYLYPRFKQLSVSIISILSILVVTLVVWLVLVFMSVVHGMEKNWTEKLIALSAPMQIMPTEAYYQSDYYQIDAISHEANYNYKTIEEKRLSSLSYDPLTDEEPPLHWISSMGRDLVKDVFESVNKVHKKSSFPIKANDFQVSVANARFRLLRSHGDCNLGHCADSQSFLTQIAYLASFEAKNNLLQKTHLPMTAKDLTNIFSLLGTSADSIQQDQPAKDAILSGAIFRKRLDHFLTHAKITHLKTGNEGYFFSRNFLPHRGEIKAILINSHTLFIPKESTKLKYFYQLYEKNNHKLEKAKIDLSKNRVYLTNAQKPLSNFQLLLQPSLELKASLVTSSIKSAMLPQHLKFLIMDQIQGITFSKEVFFNDLEIGSAELSTEFQKNPNLPPFWAYYLKSNKDKSLFLPQDPEVGEGVLLPKSYRESGVLCGDRGYLSYQCQTTSSMQEMRIPIFVSGFYDPGLIPNSGKVILAPKKIIATINAAISVKDSSVGNGINVWFAPIHQADQIKAELIKDFKDKGIDRFWKIQTYKEYEYTKAFIEQLSSDRTLFTLIALIIIMVACTNIISMLILLVNDKRKEIGILQAMGASKKSVALIFGGCGLAIGLLSSLVGTFFAQLTLKNIGPIINFINKLQGHPILSPAFFGDSLPTTLNQSALLFVFTTTLFLSLIAALFPALKAMKLNPSDILKSEN